MRWVICSGVVVSTFSSALAQSLGGIPEYGIECKDASLLGTGAPFCSNAEAVLRTGFNAALDGSTSSSWPISTPCARNGTDTYCVFANPTFANGRGLVLLTTPERASDLSAATAFSDSTLFSAIQRLNAPDNPKWAIERIPGKGLGVVATQRFEVGDHVMSATPSIMVDYGIYESLSGADVSRLQSEGIESLPRAHRAEFLNLSAHDRVENHEQLVSGILTTNAFDILHAGDVEEEGADAWYTVFPHVSRFNHDCRPNADYRFDPVTFTQHVHAVRPILAGEEITVSYLDLVQTREDRRTRIKMNWHFDCSCSLCTQSPIHIVESDARITQILYLREQLRDRTSSSLATPQMAELVVSLYEQERMWAMLYEAYALAAAEWNGVGEPWVASKYARLAVQFGLAGPGAGNGDVGDMLRLVRDPWDHWSWTFRLRRGVGG
ncbi:hypothetical protein GGR57DRAFT_505962 [Xylariaceae sp. FL1272]|nr:hypothetical protein GGR57DRAFT_505962 [Xylariaceae sp. FL1272]